MAAESIPYCVKKSDLRGREMEIDVTVSGHSFFLSAESSGLGDDGYLHGERIELKLDEGQLRVLEARIKDVLFEHMKSRKAQGRSAWRDHVPA